MIAPPAPKRRNVALGILLLARGRADGFIHFDATPQAVLSSLAPWAAITIVAFALSLVSSHAVVLQTYLLAGAVGLLAQLVVSFELARRWGRGAEWFRFAAAFCWCHWATPIAMLALILIMSVLLAMGIAEESVARVGVVALMGYGLWLHWFLAWRGLDLTRLRALALVLIVDAVTLVLINLPEWAAMSS